ncbi:MAG: hypothetical protein JST26_05615 [Bacteroidetes bacterium]|nr:hypothetical protein [Bacteroidota bacterium]
MEHYILNRKIITLERNKDTSLPIPVLFNAETAEFIIEVTEEQLQEKTYLELSAYRSIGKEDGLKKIQIELQSPGVHFKFGDFVDVEPKDYLLYSCKANRAVRLSLSITAKE